MLPTVSQNLILKEGILNCHTHINKELKRMEFIDALCKKFTLEVDRL